MAAARRPTCCSSSASASWPACSGSLSGLAIDWFPTSASEQAGPIDTLWDVLLIFSVPVFVLVMVVVLYSVWRFRMRPGEEDLDGPPIHGNTRLEIVWTAIPAILLVALCSYAYVVLTDIEEADARALNVRVVGEQFTWTFYYRAGDRQVASAQLYVPRGRQVNFTIQSKDVIHDFWVPAFRMKIDAVPGVNTNIRVTPTETGVYPVVCAELCGLGHAAMRQSAHVVETGEFEQWLEERASQRAGGGAGSAEARTRPPAAPTARRSSRPRAAAAATSSPTRARRAAPAPTSRSSRARTRPTSARAS